MNNHLFESFEARRLLAFTPGGPPVVVDASSNGVEAVSGLADGRYVVAYTQPAAGGMWVALNDGTDTPIGAPSVVAAAAVPGTVDVSMAGDGSFVVTYAFDDASGNVNDIYARQYNAFGVAVAPAVVVNTSLPGQQTFSRVATSTNGSFVVVWTDSSTGSATVMQRRYNADGTPAGAETVVGAGDKPDVAMNGSGEYVIVWDSGTNIVAQEFSSSGAPVGPANGVTTSGGALPVVGMATDSSYVVAWTNGPDSPSDVFYRRYNAAGSPIAGAAVATSDPAGDEAYPQIDVAGSGKFTVGWLEPTGGTGPYINVGFRAFTAAGAPLTDDTYINSITTAVGRFGVLNRDGTPLRIAYADSSAAVVQSYGNQLSITLDNTGQVVQITGSPTNIRVSIDGVVTNYGSPANFTAINVVGGDGDDYIRAKNIDLRMVVTGGAGNDSITTAEGNDFVDGGLGNDAINTGAGDDYAYGADETDTMFGGAGNDTLTGGPGRNWLYGEDGDDLLNGSNRPDILYGGAGRDRLRGFAGGDALFGGDGDDHLEGMAGNDALWGEEGNDYIEGAEGNDKIVGGAGDDTMFGAANVDTLFGNAGADFMDGGEEGDYGYYDAFDILISIEIRRLTA